LELRAIVTVKPRGHSASPGVPATSWSGSGREPSDAPPALAGLDRVLLPFGRHLRVPANDEGIAVLRPVEDGA
jgi:hypothetical protein